MGVRRGNHMLMSVRRGNPADGRVRGNPADGRAQGESYADGRAQGESC